MLERQQYSINCKYFNLFMCKIILSLFMQSSKIPWHTVKNILGWIRISNLQQHKFEFFNNDLFTMTVLAIFQRLDMCTTLGPLLPVVLTLWWHWPYITDTYHLSRKIFFQFNEWSGSYIPNNRKQCRRGTVTWKIFHQYFAQLL